MIIENCFSCNTTFICLLLFLISSFALFFICLLLRLFLVILFVFWSPFDCVSFDGLAPFQQYLSPHSCMCISLVLSPGERMRLKLVLKSEKKNPETNQNALLPSDSMTSLYYRTAMKYKGVLCPCDLRGMVSLFIYSSLCNALAFAWCARKCLKSD